MDSTEDRPSESEVKALKAVVNLIRVSEPLIFDLWRSHELTIAQVQCLRVLSLQDEQAGELAKKLSMSSTSLTRILERLESRALVERTTDLHDRRRVWVRLTETGRTRVSELTSWYTTSLFVAIQQMTAHDREVFTYALNSFTNAVHDIENGGNETIGLSSADDAQ